MRVNQIVVVGASSGGVEALRIIAASLPEHLSAPVCVVLHTSPESPAILSDLLDRVGPLRVVTASNRERLAPGTIYVAPPDSHLLVEPGTLRLTKGPKENRFRPAIDPLFRSAAQVYGPAVIGVILTGNLDDGTAGLWAIKHLGGIAVVQDPSDAMFPGMPRSALEHVDSDYVVRLTEIGPLIADLTSKPIDERRVPPGEVPEHLEVEMEIAREQNALAAGLERVTTPSTFACPECHGVLLQMKEGGRVKFRCHTGHAYSVESLLAAVNDAIEQSLWNAVRAIEEGDLLLTRMATQYKSSGNVDEARIVEMVQKTRTQAEAVRKIVLDHQPLTVSK
jgi:two-component system, chemotaxis family, protein-glutamate methylesterase/glutaminase